MCLDVSEKRSCKQKSKPNKDNSAIAETMAAPGDLRLHQLAGGNIIELAPLFSADSE